MDLKFGGETVYAYTGGKAFDAKLPAVVFIHGGENDHSVWALQSRYLAHHGYGVLALDLPGHGRSSGAALDNIGALADWLAKVLDAAGVARAALVGHSMGSLIAIECAARHPDTISRIALLGATLPMRVSPELLDATRDDEAAALDMINIWSHSSYAHYPGNPGPGFWVAGGNLRLMQRQKAGVLHTDFRACNEYLDGLVSAAKIACPVLCIMGKRDLMTPPRTARELLKALKQVQTLEIAGSGHALMAEKPDEVLDGLVAFLAQQSVPA